MRMLPAYFALELICGHSIPGGGTPDNTKEQNIREGHAMVVHMCRCDFGYDLIAWHDDLCKTKDEGYRWGRRRVIPNIIKDALNGPEWLELVAKIERVDAARLARRMAKRQETK